MSSVATRNNTLPARGTAREETALTVRDETSRELAASSYEVAARAEIEGAIIVAKKFPRNEERCFGQLMKSCQRFSFAADTAYSFPRGGELVSGPSIYLAKECARIWGNVRYGCNVISDDDEQRHIRGWAWDVETNTRTEFEDSFAKLVYRKKGGWQKPDERDLRELTNRRAAILMRNCILALMPSDLIDDAMAESKKTIEEGVSKDPTAHTKAIIKGFQMLNISVEDLEVYLGKPVGRAAPADIANLRTIFKSIQDGNSRWEDYVDSPSSKPATNPGGAAVSDLMNPQATQHITKPTEAPTPEPTVEAAAEMPADFGGFILAITQADTLPKVNELYNAAKKLCNDPGDEADLDSTRQKCIDRIKASRGQGSNKSQSLLGDEAADGSKSYPK